jgi:hypothetical protein
MTDTPDRRQVAEWSDTALAALDAVHGDREQLTDEQFLRDALYAVHKLRQALDGIEGELLLAARDGAKPLLSWRALGEILDMHFTSIRERHDRLAASSTARGA